MSDPRTPLDGPLTHDPTAAMYQTGQGTYPEARERCDGMLAAAVEGLHLGAWDRQILTWLTIKDMSVVATIASLLWRARHAGPPGCPDRSATSTRLYRTCQELIVQVTELTAERDHLRAELQQAPAPEEGQ
jgi:hypothetical protein